MPPFTEERLKAVAQHRMLQRQAVFILLFGDVPAVRMGKRAEQVKGAAHIQLFAGLHVQKGQIHGAAAAVAGAAGDVALGEQQLLFKIRIEIGLHADILVLDPPEHELLYRTGRTVRIKDLQPESLNDQLGADSLERAGGLDGQQRAGLFIAVDPLADEIIGGIITDLLHNVRHIIRQQHKARRVHGRIIPVLCPHASLSPLMLLPSAAEPAA